MKLENIGDIEIWNQFRKGEDFAISSIYSQNVEFLYQYGLKFTLKRDLIEDAINNLFLDLIKNRKTIGETDNIRYYLMKSFRRKLVREIKKEVHYCNNLFSKVVLDFSYSIENEIIHEESKKEIYIRLSLAIEKLSPRQKEAIYLKFKSGFDYNDISEIMNMSIDASRNLIYRAIKSLKKSISKYSYNTVLFFIFMKFLILSSLY